MRTEAKEEKLYKVYRSFRFTEDGHTSTILNPSAEVRCTEITAMAINTMQPMTLRKIKEVTNTG